MHAAVIARPPVLPESEGRFAEARITQILDLLLTAAHIDGRVDATERAALGLYLESVIVFLARPPAGALVNPERRRRELRVELGVVYASLDAEIAAASAEVLHRGDDGYVSGRLMVRAVAIFGAFTPPEQTMALAMLRAMMQADGVITSQERLLHDELLTHLVAAPAPTPTSATAPRPMAVLAPEWNPLKATAHPLLDPLEETYSPHPVELRSQIDRDYVLICQAIERWTAMRAHGFGRLTGVTSVDQLPAGARFLDGHVHVMRPDRPVELVVLGDLHGCYGCLKAALLQSDFIRRVWAHQWDPVTYPDVKLVLLGDYIDRGRFSFDGVLRAVLQLLVAMPDHVIVLRGNHELFVHRDGAIRSAVYPAEALPSIAPFVPPAMLEAYRLLFEAMPTSFLFDRTLFVHAGIPRDDTFAARYRDLASLNDPDLRFQMLWSDPSQTEEVPVALQRRNPRFSFGRRQFRTFMERIGCRTMVRGHEQVDHGFEVTYDLGDLLLLNVFSAGGADNRDLPEDAAYRRVTPMALTIRHGEGEPVAQPWPIHYQPFNHDTCNGLHRERPLLPLRHG